MDGLYIVQDMKTIVAILFILGCGWAFLAWMVVLLPIGIIILEYSYQLHDIAFSLLGSALSLVGYWIWFGWGFRWKTGRYPVVSAKTFWTISLVTHILWALAIPFGYKETITEFWLHGDTLPFRSWIGITIVVAIIGLFIETHGATSHQTKAQQVAPSNGDNAPS